MKSLMALALLTLAALVAAPPAQAQAQTQAEPMALVKSFYVANFNDEKMPLSARLAKLLDAAIANSKKINSPVEGLDFAWTMNAQDAEDGWEKSAKISETKRQDDRATVRALFRNNKRDNELLFDMVREGGKWKVDDISSVLRDKWVLSQMLLRGAKEK